MKNIMKEYLGNDYSKNHLKNFCLYWMKGRAMMPPYENSMEGQARYNEWRRVNDLDCMYFDGDLRADTLMSAWTPIKWVAECVNSEYDMKFYKTAKKYDDPDYYLKLLAYDRDAYLPPTHNLVQLLDCFLTLAEQRCNFILLPNRNMNRERYEANICGEKMNLYDEIPAMLYYIFEEDGLGRYFLDGEGNLDDGALASWIRHEHLEMGFDGSVISRAHIIPLVSGLEPSKARWFTEENEIGDALTYMIRFLERRQKFFAKS